MKKGQKLIYGFNDKENMIYCTYTGEYKISKSGDIIITARTIDGDAIIADITLFKQLNSICEKCTCLGATCNGTTCQTWTGCVYRKTN